MHQNQGHLNIYVKDHDSVVTNYGKHDRVICFHPSFDSDLDELIMYCRVDHKWNLGEPTDQDILVVARKDQDIKGRFKLAKIEKWDCGKSTDYYFIKQ